MTKADETVELKPPTKEEIAAAKLVLAKVNTLAQAQVASQGFRIGRYSKVIAAIAGNVVAIALAWLALQFPAIAECRVGPDGTDACTILGVTQAQITGALMLLVNTYFVYQAPANDPPA